MERLSDNAIYIINELHTERLHYFSEYIPLIDAANLLAAYEDTGLTPQEIEQMKARMPLHQWAGESPEKISIFGITISKIMKLAKAEKEGRLVILSVQDIHPCRNCETGWGSISSDGCHSCEETCIRLKEYNKKYNT